MYSDSAGSSMVGNTTIYRRSLDMDCTWIQDPHQERPDRIHWANAEACPQRSLRDFCTGFALGVDAAQARSGRQTSRSPSSKGE